MDADWVEHYTALKLDLLHHIGEFGLEEFEKYVLENWSIEDILFFVDILTKTASLKQLEGDEPVLLTLFPKIAAFAIFGFGVTAASVANQKGLEGLRQERLVKKTIRELEETTDKAGNCAQGGGITIEQIWKALQANGAALAEVKAQGEANGAALAEVKATGDETRGFAENAARDAEWLRRDREKRIKENSDKGAANELQGRVNNGTAEEDKGYNKRKIASFKKVYGMKCAYGDKKAVYSNEAESLSMTPTAYARAYTRWLEKNHPPGGKTDK